MKHLLLAFILASSLQAGDHHVVLSQNGMGLMPDKQVHLVGGMLIGTAGYMLAKQCGSEHPERWGFVLAVLAVLAGLAKEYLDYRKPNGTADFMDAAWTGIGGSVVLMKFQM